MDNGDSRGSGGGASGGWTGGVRGPEHQHRLSDMEVDVIDDSDRPRGGVPGSSDPRHVGRANPRGVTSDILDDYRRHSLRQPPPHLPPAPPAPQRPGKPRAEHHRHHPPASSHSHPASISPSASTTDQLDPDSESPYFLSPEASERDSQSQSRPLSSGAAHGRGSSQSTGGRSGSASAPRRPGSGGGGGGGGPGPGPPSSASGSGVFWRHGGSSSVSSGFSPVDGMGPLTPATQHALAHADGHLNLSESGSSSLRAMRGASRRNVSRACEQCRSRKSKCSGEMPCALCERLGKECIYSMVADGRLTDRTAKRKIELLQDQVSTLEKDLAEALDRADALAMGTAELEQQGVPGSSLMKDNVARSRRPRNSDHGEIHVGPSPGKHASTLGTLPQVDSHSPERAFTFGLGHLPPPPQLAPLREVPPAPQRVHMIHESPRGAAYDSLEGEGLEVDRSDPESAPFGTGRFVLSPTGNLHLFPAATFYFPAHLAPDWQKALDAMTPGGPGSASRPQRRGYLAPYLPFPLDPVHHAMLLDACFFHLFSFGRNAFRDKFESEMVEDPMARGNYFSPMLHLTILAIGWRYMAPDDRLTRTYYCDDNTAQRGEAFVTRALEMMLDDVADPRLSTVIGLIALSEYHTGMLKEPIGRSLYSMAMSITQDLRLHRRCDQQLAEIGMTVDSELDIARRDVYGLALNLSAWYSTYVGQEPVPLRTHADQRLPLVRTDLRGSERDASEMFHYHVQISDYGLQALHCNHTLRAPMAVRVERVKAIWRNILAWRDSVPERLRWPPRNGMVLHPSVVTTHGMAATYVIMLFRPYILELSEHRSRIYDLALGACLAAASDIVAQSRYLSAVGGVTAAPMSWHHILYVCGSMLVLQATGLPSVPEAEREQALGDLDYLQTALDEIVPVWPIAGHTAMSLRQLLAAARGRR